MSGKTLLYVVNVDWFFISHRLPIALKAIEDGYKVHIACKNTGKKEFLQSHGLVVHDLPLSRSKKNIYKELIAFNAIRKIITLIKPDIVHSVTIKPVIYAGLASKFCGVKNKVSSISGLGYVFVAKGLKPQLLRFFVSILYRLVLGGNSHIVILQNDNDYKILLKIGAISKNNSVLIRGSGVDLKQYKNVPEPEGTPIVIMASRLLCEKGVIEYVEAARKLYNISTKAKFWLVGDTDPGNPNSISEAQLSQWSKEEYIEVLGFRADISLLFNQSAIVVLPSFYGEGLPKVLIEAAACGRAVVTTDHPGCRDAIEEGVTGLLVKVKDIEDLANAINILLQDSKKRFEMGEAGRNLAEQEFDIRKVISKHMQIYEGFFD